MSKIFARLRRATFTILPRSGPLLSFCPKSTARRAFSVLTQIGRTFRIPSDYEPNQSSLFVHTLFFSILLFFED